MKVNITYPTIKKGKLTREELINKTKWPFLFAAYASIITNVCIGGKAWSAIVSWSIYIVWSLIFAPSVIEYNRISQAIKFITQSCILLILINVLLSPGWASEVVPIVCFGGLVVVAILFFTDLEKQKHNMLPMLLLISASFIAAIVGIVVFRSTSIWQFIVMGAISLALLIACIIAINGEALQELKKMFHTK